MVLTGTIALEGPWDVLEFLFDVVLVTDLVGSLHKGIHSRPMV